MNRKQVIPLILFSLTLNLCFIIPTQAAANFVPNYIISDEELVNYQSMTQEEIYSFLTAQNGALKEYWTKDIDGMIKHAAEIIYGASQRYQINPQVLITLLQKEQTLITRPVKKNTQYEWATGFACYDYTKPVSKFKGFAMQVDRAAWRLRYFLEHPWEFKFRAGQLYKLSWGLLKPQNQATAALYNYTPHYNGNKLFWNIWQNWFANKTGIFPDGTLLQVNGEQGIWLIQHGQRRPFKSKNVFLAGYTFKRVIKISKKELEKYPIGPEMTFPNYSLLRSPDKKVYLLIDGVKRHIVSEQIFRKIGFNPEEIINVDNNDLVKYPDGKPITTPYPTGILAQNKDTGAIYYIQEDIKYPIINTVILENNYPGQSPITISSEELNNLNNGEPILLRDGSLIKTLNSPTVYLISRGKKMPIDSEETFKAMGYQWSDVQTVNEAVLNLHPLDEKTLSMASNN